MSVALTYVSRVAAIETVPGPYVSPLDATVTVDQLSTSKSLTGSTTPPVTKESAFQKTLSSGAGTIDCTALPGLNSGDLVDGTGLKIQVLKFRNKSTNANSMTVSKGASNGLGLNAAGTTWSVPISPGQEVTVYGDDAGPDVGSGAKNIDVAGTGAQILEVHVVMG